MFDMGPKAVTTFFTNTSLLLMVHMRELQKAVWSKGALLHEACCSCPKLVIAVLGPLLQDARKRERDGAELHSMQQSYTIADGAYHATCRCAEVMPLIDDVKADVACHLFAGCMPIELFLST